ncbi:MAG TPA: response regulator, partial [Solirubrobacterales bacterium]
MSAGARILAIDDDAEVLRVVERTLARRFECEFARDVPSAREKLATGGFDLALCDIQMPGGSGLDLVEEMAADGARTGVVLITGMEDTGVVG